MTWCISLYIRDGWGELLLLLSFFHLLPVCPTVRYSWLNHYPHMWCKISNNTISNLQWNFLSWQLDMLMLLCLRDKLHQKYKFQHGMIIACCVLCSVCFLLVDNDVCVWVYTMICVFVCTCWPRKRGREVNVYCCSMFCSDLDICHWALLLGDWC